VFRRKLAIIVPVLVTLIFGAWTVIIGPLLPNIAGDFGISVEIAGLLLALNFAGALVSVMLGGILADRFGKQQVFAVALGGFAAAAFLFAVGQSFAVIAGACLLGGAMGCSLEGLCGAIFADHDPARRGRNMNLLQIAFSTGAVAALVTTSLLHRYTVPWQTIYLALAWVTALVFLFSLFMRVSPAPADAPISLPIVRRVITDPLLVLLVVAIALYVGAEMGLAQWISRILTLGGSGEATAMLAPALFWGMTGVGRFASGVLCHRFSDLRVLTWLLAGGLLSFLVLLLPFGQWPLWVGTALAGLTFSGVWPLIVSQGSGRYPAYSGTAIALLVVAGNVGGMLFPALVGFPVEGGASWLGILYVGMLFLLLTVTIYLYARLSRAGQSVALPVTNHN
jgi:fucose permease